MSIARGGRTHAGGVWMCRNRVHHLALLRYFLVSQAEPFASLRRNFDARDWSRAACGRWAVFAARQVFLLETVAGDAVLVVVSVVDRKDIAKITGGLSFGVAPPKS